MHRGVILVRFSSVPVKLEKGGNAGELTLAKLGPLISFSPRKKELNMITFANQTRIYSIRAIIMMALDNPDWDDEKFFNISRFFAGVVIRQIGA